MQRQGLLLALLLLTVAVVVAYLAGRESRLTSVSAGDGAPIADESAGLREQLERSERQGLLFSRRLGELETELESARAAAKSAPPPTPPPTPPPPTPPPPTPPDDTRLVAIEADLQRAVETLTELGRAQVEQGAAAKSAQDELLKLFGELVARSPAKVEGLDALAAKLTTLEASCGKTAGEVGAAVQSVAKLGESLDKLLADSATSRATRDAEISRLAGEIGRLHETISAATSDLSSFRTALLDTVRGFGAVSERVDGAPTEDETGSPGPAGVSSGKPPAVRADSRSPVAAEVRAVDPLKGVVILDKGESDGLEQGELFEIRRRDLSIGKLRIIRLWDTYSGAEVVETLAGEKVRSGDVAHRSDVVRDAGVSGPPVRTESGTGTAGDASRTGTHGGAVISGSPQERSPPPPPPGG